MIHITKGDNGDSQGNPQPRFREALPDKVRYYAKPGEVAKAGYTKLGEAMEATAKEEKKVKDKVYKSVEFTGSAKEGIKKF